MNHCKIPLHGVLLILALSALAQAAPPAPQVERTAIVTGQGYFPVAIRLQDGRIAVVMRGGAPHIGLAGRLDVAFSSDEGKTWTKPTVVIDSEWDDRNPAFGQAKDGTLIVGYWECRNYNEQGKFVDVPGKSKTKVVRSTDGGKSWSKPIDIDVSDLDYGSPYGKIITLADGAMLMPVYGSAVNGGGKRGRKGDFSYFYRSADNGQTWSRYSTIGAERFNETGVVRLASGEMLAAMRTVAPVQDVWLTRSKDDGKTWSEPKQLTQKLVHPADMVQLPDGRVLLVSGDRRNPFGVIGIVSEADKLDFANVFVLTNQSTNTDTGYPSSVVLKDGKVLTAYYAVGDKEHTDWGTHCGSLIYTPPAR
jgi:hypothetical protein